MRWAVQIQRTTLERRNIEDLLAGLGFRVLETEGCISFTCDEMNQLGAVSVVFELAKRVREAMTGPSGVDSEFQLGAVIDFAADPPKRVACLEAIGIETGPPVLGRPALNVHPPQGLSASELQAWKDEQAERAYQAKLESQRARLEPAFKYERAEKMLTFLAQDGPTGETLYKIYELAEGHPSDRKQFHARFGIHAEEFKRFKDAVHNPAVSGDWARHAYLEEPKSDRPMSRAEASRFVRHIAAEWLKSVRKSS